MPMPPRRLRAFAFVFGVAMQRAAPASAPGARRSADKNAKDRSAPDPDEDKRKAKA